MTVKRENTSTFKPITGDRFRFRCHKDIQCFTRCCQDLRLILTPYDILRLKTRLAISSEDFLDNHTDTSFNTHPRFPMVILKMRQDKDKRCPFVTSEGCTIYEDRPSACRIYPLGRASANPLGRENTLEKFFVVKEDHCLGFQEDRGWSIEEWLDNEGINEYNSMNDRWSEIITSSKGLGPEKNVQKKIQMFYMASYNLDRFREFLFKSPFFDRFEVDPDLIEKLASDDVSLMRFAFDWLKFSLFSDKTIHIKSFGM